MAGQTASLDPGVIDEIVERIVSADQPRRIILFGSAATGKMTKDSDIDLLILDDDPGDTCQESVRLHSALDGIPYAGPERAK